MAFDPLSPIAPARVRAIVLPVGRLKRSRFAEFLQLLREQRAVRLGDVTPDARPDRSMFTPLAFPNGAVLYDFCTSVPPASHSSLSPFELFRETLVVIGVADALEYAASKSPGDVGAEHKNRAGSIAEEVKSSGVAAQFGMIQERFSKALIHRLFYFDRELDSDSGLLPKGTVLIPPENQRNSTTIKTTICDVTSSLLGELTTLAKSLQGLPSIPSPGAPKTYPSHEQSRRWTSVQPFNSSQRNSQTDYSPQSDSPARNADRNINRRSTPVRNGSPSSNLASSIREDSRSASPSSGSSTPPTTFDEIASSNSSRDMSKPNGGIRPGSNASSRATSSERVSMHGFGSGSVLERARNKGKCRVGIVIGGLYLCAGRWYDALREFADNAEQARLLSDHLWHAKGLENILVSLLLLAWAKCDFQIPKICFPEGERAGGIKSPVQSPLTTTIEAFSPSTQRSSANPTSLHSLRMVFPSLVNNILGLYARASNFQGEDLPQLPFSETVIRLCKTSAALNVANGNFSEACLRMIVESDQSIVKLVPKVSRVTITPNRSEIANTLFRAFPFAFDPSELSVVDHTNLLAGISSVLASLGMHRKKAIVMKEYVETLIPALVQARKLGAAEMGVHPATGLAALPLSGGFFSSRSSISSSGLESDSGILDFLDLLGLVYGVPGTVRLASHLPTTAVDEKDNITPANPEQLASQRDDDKTQKLVNYILQDSHSRAFGNLNLKLDILRLCVSFCEALPHFHGVLHFTAALLRVAGPGNAPIPNSVDVIVSLAREEQIRLATNLSRTVTAATKLGITNIGANFWDDFLVRGLEIVPASGPKLLSSHLKADLELNPKTPIGISPFIHDRFSKQPQSEKGENIFVANEEHQLIVALQNPYEFEVEIESLDIAAEGIIISSEAKSLYLGPYRTQKFAIPVTIKGAGEGVIIGCFIKVRGCKAKFFPIFSQPWSPEWPQKLKDIGLEAAHALPSSRPLSEVSASSDNLPIQNSYPVSQTFNIKAIPEQPVLVLTDVGLPQSALMVLEGEKQTFTIAIRNISNIKADFLHLSIQDSATDAVKSALFNKDISSADLHELETQLMQRPALSWKRKDAGPVTIAPGANTKFELEVYGKAALESAVVHFDYAFLGSEEKITKRRFFTRKIKVPLTFTVNAGIQLHRLDISPFVGDFAWSNQQRRTTEETSSSIIQKKSPRPRSSENGENRFKTLLSRIGTSTDGTEHCLLLLDLRNVWPNPLSISLHVLESASTLTSFSTRDHNLEDESRRFYTVHETIQPGHVSRIVLVLPKIWLANPHAAIPAIDPSKARQFIVSASRIAPETERSNREAFWFREELLKRIRGTWQEQGTERTGTIELRGVRLSNRMVEALRGDDIAIEFSLRLDEPDSSDEQLAIPSREDSSGDTLGAKSAGVTRTGRSRFAVPVDAFLALTARVTNRSPAPRKLLLRLQPSLCNLPHTAALDLDRKLTWSGVLQRPLPVLPPGGSVEVGLGLCALCSGTYEVGGTVEEVRVLDEGVGERGEERDGEEGEKRSGRRRTDTGLMRDSLLGEKERRVWHSFEACTIVASKM